MYNWWFRSISCWKPLLPSKPSNTNDFDRRCKRVRNSYQYVRKKCSIILFENVLFNIVFEAFLQSKNVAAIKTVFKSIFNINSEKCYKGETVRINFRTFLFPNVIAKTWNLSWAPFCTFWHLLSICQSWRKRANFVLKEKKKNFELCKKW